MNWLEELAFTVVIAVLNQVIKNPGSRKVECTVVAEIASLAGQAQVALGCK